MSTPGRVLETTANVALVVSSCLLLTFVGVTWSKSRSQPTARTERAVKPGDHLVLTGVNWAAHTKNYIFALQVGCRYCTASAPQLRTIIAEASSHKDVGLVAVLPQDQEGSRNYLSALNLTLPSAQSRLSTLRVLGTPTTIMCDSAGVVQAVWFGQLDLRKQEEILSTMSSKGKEQHGKSS
jgi:hypothetical protein